MFYKVVGRGIFHRDRLLQELKQKGIMNPEMILSVVDKKNRLILPDGTRILKIHSKNVD